MPLAKWNSVDRARWDARRVGPITLATPYLQFDMHREELQTFHVRPVGPVVFFHAVFSPDKRNVVNYSDSEERLGMVPKGYQTIRRLGMVVFDREDGRLKRIAVSAAVISDIREGMATFGLENPGGVWGLDLIISRTGYGKQIRYWANCRKTRLKKDERLKFMTARPDVNEFITSYARAMREREEQELKRQAEVTRLASQLSVEYGQTITLHKAKKCKNCRGYAWTGLFNRCKVCNVAPGLVP